MIKQKFQSANVTSATASWGMLDEYAIHRVAIVASGIAVFIGVCALLGWIFHIALLTSVLPGLPTMKATTAIAFVLIGISLKLQIKVNSMTSRTVAAACALLAGMVGALTLCEYAFGIQLGIDQILFYVPASEVSDTFPGRMAPNTAFNFALLGVALLLLDNTNRVLRAFSHGLVIVVFFMAFIAIVGFLLNVSALYGVPGYASMALHTAVGLAVLAVGIFTARPQRGVAAILTQDNPAGVTARRLLPLIAFTVLGIGWLRLKGQQAGFYGTEFGLAMMITVSTSILTSIVLWNAKAQGRAHKSQQEAARLIDAVKDYAIFMLDPNGNIVTWNTGAQRLKGYKPGEIIGKSFSCFYTRDDQTRGKPAEELRIAARDERYQDEGWRVRNDGSKFMANVVITALRNDRQQLVGFAKVTRDITDQKRADEMRQDMTALVESAEDAILTKNLNSIVRSWNPAAQRLLGYSAEEIIGQSITCLLPDDRQEEETMILDQIRQGQPVAHFETVRRRKDGSLLDVSLTISPIRDRAGTIVGASKIMRDITERNRAAEQLRTLNTQLEEQVKLRIAELRSTQHDLAAIMDAMPSMIGYWDKHLRNRFANHAYQSWFGVDPKILTGMHIRDLLGDELYERNRPYREAVLRGESVTFEQRIPLPDAAGIRHAIAHYFPDIVNGEIQGFYVLVHDITELTESKLKMAALLRENEGLLHTLDYQSLVSMADASGKIVYVNDAFCAVSCYTRDELLGQDHRVVSSGTHSGEFWRKMWRVISSGSPWQGEICNRTKFGTIHWVSAVIAPIFGDDGKIAKYISIRTDITANKRIAAQLQEINERFAVASEAAHLGVWEFDVTRNRLIWDDQMYRIYGCSRSDKSEPYQLWANSLHPEDRARCEAEIALAIRGEKEFITEFRIVRPDGSTGYISASSHTVYAADGTAIRMTGTNIDVTERSHIERKLFEMSSLLQTVLDSVSEVAVIAGDSNLNITVFNTGAERLLGYASEEIIGRAMPALFHDADEVRARAKELSTQLGREVVGGAVFTEPSTLREPRNWTYIRKDGKRVPVSVVVTSMHTSSGELFGYVGVAHDVTRREQY